ncbi:hypothetical protein [Thiocapsa rosea]|nr:hypothetical protein [Thiocapsa rosea]
MTMLARGPETRRAYLNVYDKSPTARGAQDDPKALEPLNRLVATEYFQTMLASFAGGGATDETAEAQLKRLPTWMIVFTDELVDAVTQFDVDTFGREAAQARPRTLWWQRPDSSELNGLIDECIDSGKPARAKKTTPGKTPREHQKSTTHKRYRRWQDDYVKLKKENPEQTDSWISEQIHKLERKRFDDDPHKIGRVRSVGTIVKNMKPGRK